MSEKSLSRRSFLRTGAIAVGGVALAACQPKIVEVEKVITKEVEKVVKETVIVEGTPQVVEKTVKEVVKEVVTATPAPKGKVKIVSTSQMGIATWENSLKRAQEMYPEIELEASQTAMPGGWSGYADQVITKIAGGDQLDLIMIAIEGLGLLSSKKVILPLDDMFDADPVNKDLLMNDTHKVLREMMQYDGKQMQFPFSWNNMVIHYNTAIFEEAGVPAPEPNWDWEDFLAVCEKVANVKGTEDDRYAVSFWGGGMFGMSAWYFNNDTSTLTKGWVDSNMMDPKVTDTLQFMADLINKYKFAPNPAGWDEWGQFYAGHLAMRICGRWCIGGCLTEGFETYDLAYMPHRAGALKTVAGTDGWGMATLCKNKEEAWKMLTLLSGKEASMDMTRLGGNVPTLRSIAETPEFREYGPANTALFYQSLDYADTVPSPNNFNIVEPVLDRNYSGIWNNEVSVAEAVQAAHTELQAEMDKLKK
jgi:multiple sugar transport system substrate-binding protein